MVNFPVDVFTNVPSVGYSTKSHNEIHIHPPPLLTTSTRDRWTNTCICTCIHMLYVRICTHSPSYAHTNTHTHTDRIIPLDLANKWLPSTVKRCWSGYCGRLWSGCLDFNPENISSTYPLHMQKNSKWIHRLRQMLFVYTSFCCVSWEFW